MKTEYTAIGENGVRVITEQEAKENTTENIYYLDGLAEDYKFEQGKRAKDTDIKMKDFFVLDLDIRNNCSFEVTNEEIIQEGKNFAKYLDQEDEYFGEWNKIVFSGNGLHFYYKGNPREFDKNMYSLGVDRIYRQWNSFIGDSKFYCDGACKNLARILRLPGSINQKNGAKVEIIAQQETQSRLFNMIESFAKKELLEKEEEKQRRKKEIEEHLKDSKGDGKFYDEINIIPAYLIAQGLVPDFPYDGKKNFKNKKGGYTGYFYIEETNTIANGGSRYFDWGTASSCWNNFSLVKNFNNWTNHETFKYFKKLLGKK